MNRLQFLSLVVSVAMLFTACDRGGNSVVPTPEESSLILNSLAVVEVEAEGGEVEILYTLKNPVSGAEIEVAHPEWVDGYDVAQGVITLEVSANTDNKAREGVVKVSYLAKSFDVTLFQAGATNEEPNPDVVNFEARMLTGEYYGEYYTPGYGNYYIFLTDNGFNEEGNYLPNSHYYRLDLYAPLREGEFTGEVEIPDGVYELDMESTLAMGTFSEAYSEYIATTDSDMREVGFSQGRFVVENGSYTLDVVIDGKKHHVTFNGDSTITDRTDSVVPPEEVEVEIMSHWGVYYGDRYSPGMGNYFLVLSPDGWDAEGSELPNGRYYRFDLYAPMTDGEATDEVAIPEGEYLLDMSSSCGAYTAAYGAYSSYAVMDATGGGYAFEAQYLGCKLTVTDSGITAIVQFNNEIHTLTYNGAPLFIENGTGSSGSDSLSNLRSDLTCDLSDHVVMYRGYGDYYENGTTNWTLLIAPSSSVGDAVQFDLLTSGEQTEDFTGTFSCRTDYSANSFFQGTIENDFLVGSWYYSSDDQGALVSYAPFIDGELTIVANDDGTTTITFECYDDLGNSISGSWTGSDLMSV